MLRRCAHCAWRVQAGGRRPLRTTAGQSVPRGRHRSPGSARATVRPTVEGPPRAQRTDKEEEARPPAVFDLDAEEKRQQRDSQSEKGQDDSGKRFALPLAHPLARLGLYRFFYNGTSRLFEKRRTFVESLLNVPTFEFRRRQAGKSSMGMLGESDIRRLPDSDRGFRLFDSPWLLPTFVRDPVRGWSTTYHIYRMGMQSTRMLFADLIGAAPVVFEAVSQCIQQQRWDDLADISTWQLADEVRQRVESLTDRQRMLFNLTRRDLNNPKIPMTSLVPEHERPKAEVVFIRRIPSSGSEPDIQAEVLLEAVYRKRVVEKCWPLPPEPDDYDEFGLPRFVVCNLVLLRRHDDEAMQWQISALNYIAMP